MNYTVQGILQDCNNGVGSLSLLQERSSQPRDGTQISHNAGRFFTNWATGEAHIVITKNSQMLKLTSQKEQINFKWKGSN